jgi:hypothetical protein
MVVLVQQVEPVLQLDLVLLVALVVELVHIPLVVLIQQEQHVALELHLKAV